jgi:hypothetical protein
MASWQIKGSLASSAALAVIALAASARAVQKGTGAAADRTPAARIADHGDAGDQTGDVLKCCMR